MIVSVHQPHFFPWMGYLNKALRSDVFVWLHSVQYRKQYYQNRTKIKNPQTDQSFWLTLSVHAKSDAHNIDQVMLADPKWREPVLRTIENFYGKAAYFSDCWPPIAHALMQASDNLDDVNYRTFLALLQVLELGSLRVERVGNLHISSTDPTLRLVEICRLLNATHYISGKGGHNYLRAEEFEKVGIQMIWQAFDPDKVVYAQAGNTFLSGLSVLDCLLNVGPSKTKELALDAWCP